MGETLQCADYQHGRLIPAARDRDRANGNRYCTQPATTRPATSVYFHGRLIQMGRNKGLQPLVYTQAQKDPGLERDSPPC